MHLQDVSGGYFQECPVRAAGPNLPAQAAFRGTGSDGASVRCCEVKALALKGDGATSCADGPGLRREQSHM